MSAPAPPPSAGQAGPPPARARAAAIKRAWASGAVPPDTRAELSRHPDLLQDKSVVLDLAYEEYCLRREAGETVDAEAFCARFPAYRTSLWQLLQAHQFVAEHPSLLAAAEPVRFPEPGEQVGDYTLVRELGRGAFARVYLATEASTGDRPVAVKLSAEGGGEARTLGRLDHPNIVPVLSARQDASGLAVVVMPFLGSATLHDVLDRAFPVAGAPPPARAAVVLEAARAAPGDPRPPDRPADPLLAQGGYEDGVVHLGVQLAEALAFIHAHGVCHRDLKPSNVLLDPGGRPMLLDFNLSADERLTGSRAGGTLPYMAPEQVRQFRDPAVAAPPDPRGDLFALGVVLYELLTGRHPFGPVPLGTPSGEVADLLLERQRAGCPPVRSVNPRVSAAAAGVVERCLAYDPAARPADAAAVAAGLRRHFTPARRLRRWAVRRRAALAVVGCLLALAAVAAGWHVATRPPAHERARAALVASARGRLAQGDVTAALPLLLDASKVRESGPVLAAIGYCLSVKADHRGAIDYYDRTEQAGYQTAALYNNRGFSRVKLRQFDLAAADFDMALHQNPDLPAARYNRALLAYERWQPPTGTGVPIPPDAVADMEYVVSRFPDSATVRAHAARLCAAAADANEELAERGVAHARRAVELGWPASELRTEPLLRVRLGKRPDFQILETVSAGPLVSQPSFVALRLCDPLAELTD